MTFEQALLIIFAVVLWGFTIFCLFRGRKIEKEIETGSRIPRLLVFIIIAVILVIKNHTIIGIIVSVATVIAGLLYVSIPVGFNHIGIYVRGREFLYHNIEYMEIEEQEKKALLHFKYKHEYHFIMTNKENIDVLNECKSIYSKERFK